MLAAALLVQLPNPAPVTDDTRTNDAASYLAVIAGDGRAQAASAAPLQSCPPVVSLRVPSSRPRRVLTTALVVTAALSLPAAAQAGQQLCVSLGDSYAAGHEATAKGVEHTTTNGFAYQTVTKARNRGYDLTLKNFGCGGATTTSILKAKSCPTKALGPKGTAYVGITQIAAAKKFLEQRRGEVALITVSVHREEHALAGQAPAQAAGPRSRSPGSPPPTSS